MIITIIEELDLENQSKKQIEKLFSLLNKGSYIYKSIFRRKGVNSKEIDKLFELLEEKKIIKQYYSAKCPQCDKFIEKDYLLTKDMPHWIECKLCGNEFDVDKNTKKVYYYQGINQKAN